jgi:hypothetical protein
VVTLEALDTVSLALGFVGAATFEVALVVHVDPKHLGEGHALVDDIRDFHYHVLRF